MAKNIEDGIKRVLRIHCWSGIIKAFLNEAKQKITSDT